MSSLNPALPSSLFPCSPHPGALAQALSTGGDERRQHNLLMAALPQARYRHGFEPGCGTGGFTERLLTRCDSLCAVDASPAAIAQCRQRTARADQARLALHLMVLPDCWPEMQPGQCDLIVVSDLAHHFDPNELERFYRRCLSCLAPGGHWVMCHRRHGVRGQRQHTDELHRPLNACGALIPLHQHVDDEVRLGVWERAATGG